jgi:LuxR family maltose regulon positive regulatory protein
MIAILSLSNLAEMHMMEGKLGEAQEIYQRALSLALDQAGKRLPIAGMALCGLGELLRRKNLLEDARSYLEEGLLLNKSWGEIGMLDGYVSLALVKQAQGDIEGARMEIGKARNLAQSFDIIELDDLMIDAYQVCLWLVQGNLGAALEWAEQRELSMNGELSGRAWKDQSDFLGNSYLSALEQLALARLLLATGRREDSLTLLKKLFESCQKKGFGWLAFEAQTITAMAFHSLGATEQALDSLQNALSMTVTDKPIRIFLEAGKPMRELLKSYSQLPSTAGDLRSYANRILSAFEVESKMPAHEGQGDSSILEILSPREAEVLRLLAEGFSNQEIAQKMVVASSTVKSHVHHIYNKLGATKRTQAVARARELGLL